MSYEFIEGGYILLARRIFESPIWVDDPHVLKLFIYLLGKARHSGEIKKYRDFEIRRGELVTSLQKISEENEFIKNGRLQTWSRQKISRMLKVLTDQNYIQLLADTYGTHVKICNYEVYQNPELYKTDTTGTQLEQYYNINNNDKNDNNEKRGKNAFDEIHNAMRFAYGRNALPREIQDLKPLIEKQGIESVRNSLKLAAEDNVKRWKTFMERLRDGKYIPFEKEKKESDNKYNQLPKK